MPVTETQSMAYDIRDAFFDVVTADAFFNGYTARKNKWLPVQTDLVPYIGVYFIGETQIPDGDANAGCIRFSHTVTVGFSIVQSNNDKMLLEQNIDQAKQRIDTLLWTDLHLMNVLHNNNPEAVGIEGIPRATRRHVFGNANAANEFPFVELEYNVNAFCRSEWYPDITDMLNEIDVTVAVNNANVDYGGSNPEVQPITVKYMLNQLRAHRVS